MNLVNYEEPRVFVTCRSRLGLIKTIRELISEKFCHVTGLRFGVEYWPGYNNEDDPIPFRRRVFSSAKDGSLQFVLLGLKDRCGVPDWILRLANDRDGWDNIFGGIQFLGDKLVSWMSKKQDYTAMSSAEAEYVALSASCAQVMWMRTQLQDYGLYNKIPLYCDSQSAIAISCNPVQHSRTKNIHTRYQFIKKQVENGIIELYFIRTEYQFADIFTKALPEDRFKYLVKGIGMRCLTPAELKVLAKKSA
nr:retrovirus-related Pol polyprotein from transposon TNT 1-94 [Tanacetum cinerariifolium]